MFVRFLVKQMGINSIRSVLTMASRDSQTDKPQRGCSKRAELPDVNINTGTQSINTESFFNYRDGFGCQPAYRALGNDLK